MENIDIIYEEYKRLVNRHDQLLDSSFNDFKLYGILGPVLIGGSTVLLKYTENMKDLFLILLLIEFLIAIIAFRDLLKQIYINQIGYNINKIESFLRDHVISDDKKSKYEIFSLRKSWIEKYFSLTKKAYIGFLCVLFITVTVIPVSILLCIEKDAYNAILLASTILVVFSFYVLITYSVFKKSGQYEVQD